MRSEVFEVDRAGSIVPLLGRVLMSGLFFYSAFGKILAPASVIERIAEVGLPLPQFGYAVAVFVEAAVGLMFLVGLRTRSSACVLAAWCVLTALLFHFDPGNRQQDVQLLKNLAIAGGMLQFLLLGGGALSIDARLSKKSTGSTH